LPILSAAIRSRFFFVRIFHQPYLIYMPSLVEIPLAVSDISEVKDFDIRYRFPWQWQPFWKFQDLNAPHEMGIHLPVKFSKDRIISLWEFGRTNWLRRRRGGRIIIIIRNGAKTISLQTLFGLNNNNNNNNKKQSKNSMSHKLRLGAIIIIRNGANTICLSNFVWEP
jgi:hypothetical protein